MPVLAFYIVYCYVPMYGIVLAWKDYRPKFGITGSPWLGWENFEYLFSLPDLPRAIKNTLAISFLKLCICFPMPILFALLLNELRHPKYKKNGANLYLFAEFHFLGHYRQFDSHVFGL